MSDLRARVLEAIRDVPDFPKPGVLFKDITPMLAQPSLTSEVYDWMASAFDDVDVIVGLESRGFIFGAPIAERMNVPLVLARKKGKLPHVTHSVDYELEYGNATMEIHVDAIEPGQRVLICDDLLATGGTANAAERLIEQTKGHVVGCVFLIELDFLNGAEQIKAPIKSLIHY